MIHAVSKLPATVRITGNNSELQGAKIYDKDFIRLPRQDLKRPKEMAEISHLWAEWYLIYTLFIPFDLGRSTPLKERTKDMIKILFVCWGKRFQ